MKTITFVFLFSLLSITTVNAMTGNDFLNKCNVINTPKEITTKEGINCLSYISGLREMQLFMNAKFQFKFSIVSARFTVFAINAHKNGDEVKEVIDELMMLDGICIPQKVTNHQLGKIMIKKLNTEPEDLHIPMPSLFVSTMKKVFPQKTLTCNPQ
jgi:hypothetical protein